MGNDLIGAATGAAALIGFVSTWIKLGVEKGEQKKTVKQMEQQLSRHEGEIEALQRETSGIRLEIARSFAKIEVTLEYIKESLGALKGAGHAAEK